ncbi:MAG TPA: lipase secretion chaperone [Noviherbaspirillum sp.]|nr:lipase secretion chaperone [Noviherbaspirillum sp.]
MAISAFFLIQREEEPVAVRLAAERDMFAFIKPLPPTLASAEVQAEAPRHTGARHDQTLASVEQMQDRRSVRSPAEIAATEQEVQQMRSQGANEDEVYRMRAHALSAEAAAQLAEMERAEGAWQQRIHSYLTERERLLAAQNSHDHAQAMESLKQLRNTYFSAEEQERLAVYELPLVPQLKVN